MNDFIRFKKSNCKNCHKCIRYCPVKSIRFTGNQANVIADACILCGKCYVVCPQSAKEIVDETEIAKVLLSGTAPVYASVAPSFAAYFNGCGIGALRDALKKLGFADAEETAIGATLVKREYERLTREEKHDIIITTCCPSVNMLVEKYYPALVGYLAPVVTPMQAHCMDIVRRHPDAKTIFIGPCLSKKSEAQASAIDAALTFDEIYHAQRRRHNREHTVHKDAAGRCFHSCNGSGVCKLWFGRFLGNRQLRRQADAQRQRGSHHRSDLPGDRHAVLHAFNHKLYHKLSVVSKGAELERVHGG